MISGQSAVKRYLIVMAASVCMFASAFATFSLSGTYKTRLLLWTDAVTKSPNSALAHKFYADELADVVVQLRQRIESINAKQMDVNYTTKDKYALAAQEKHLADLGVWGKELAEKEKKFYKAVVEHYREAIALNPQYMDSYAQLGAFFLLCGDTEEALEQLALTEKTINAFANPSEYLYVYYLIGKTALQLNNWELGEKYLLMGSEHPKGIILCYSQLVDYLIPRGRFDSIIEITKSFAARGVKTDEVYSELGKVLERAGRDYDMIAHIKIRMKESSVEDRQEYILLLEKIQAED